MSRCGWTFQRYEKIWWRFLREIHEGGDDKRQLITHAYTFSEYTTMIRILRSTVLFVIKTKPMKYL